MRQVLEDLRDGRIYVDDVPAPLVRDGFVLVRNEWSLISSGTEGGSIKLGKMNLIAKAMARPEQAAKVIQLARTQGVFTAYQVAQRALETPLVLGYSCAGIVSAVGAGVDHVSVGDRVACGGQGFASHAEVVCVPKHLCVQAPAQVSGEQAAFATVGAIALQSVRIADVRIGDNVVVIGLGLVGLLTVQLLRAAGCRVLGIDIDQQRLDWVREQGWADVCAVADANIKERTLGWSAGSGADAIVITAATADNGPVALAGDLARHKGKVVVVGRTEIRLPREQYLFKELELRTSMAYGPGSGDPGYELEGHDYPVAYVRWTEQRNMQAFLQQVEAGAVNTDALVTHRFDVTSAADAFALVSGSRQEPAIGILLRYPREAQTPASATRVAGKSSSATAQLRTRVGVVGAGSFATNEFLPLLAKRLPHLRGVVSASGVRAAALAKKYGFAFAASDPKDVINDPETDAVLILTRHDTHADLTAQALLQGKHVFVEKPLALTAEQLAAVQAAYTVGKCALMIGYNRRYAPLAVRMRSAFAHRVQPLSVVYRANVGYRPPEHWLHHPLQGGGVLLGEACHHIDFCRWLIGAPVTGFDVRCFGGSGAGYLRQDNIHITLSCADGSLAQIQYLSNGAKSFPAETIEVSCEGRSARLIDFKLLELGHRLRTVRERAWFGSAKGHGQQLDAFLRATQNPADLDSLDYLESAQLVITINAQLAAQLGSADTGVVSPRGN